VQPSPELLLAELADAEDILNPMARIFSSGLPAFGHPTPRSNAETWARPVPATHADGIVTVDDNGTIESFNDAAQKIFGYAGTEVIGRHVSTILDAPSSSPSALSRRGRARARYKIPAGVIGKRRDGVGFAVELTSAEIEVRNEHRSVLVVRDASERSHAEAERSRAEARYRSLVEQIPAVTFMGSLNDDLIDFYVSPQIETLLGFSQEEWLSDPFLWYDHLYPDDRKLCNDEFARGCMTGGPFRAEFRALTRQGKVVWLRGEAQVVKDEDGRPLFIQGLAYDITESKLAEEAIRASAQQLEASLREKEVLLREIHHRVKNNLQVISSLLRLQSAHIQGRSMLEIFSESRNRVLSMALVHEKLYQSSDLGEVDFSEYPYSLAALLIRSYGSRAAQVTLTTRLDKISLTVDVAVPLGLIINELVSNSLKHAFPQGRGEIRIEVHRVGEGPVELTVADDGAGFPRDLDFRNTDTLGMQLVRTLSQQIGGSIELHSAGGTEFRISFSA